MQNLIKCLAVAVVFGSGFAARDVIRSEIRQDSEQEAMPQPTAEHKWLAAGAGKWKAVGKYNMGTEWVPITGVQTNTMQVGGLWQIIEFKSDDGHFVGNGIAGYDVLKKKFMSVWVDSASTEFAPASGDLSADKKTLTTTSTKTEGGKPITVTETYTRKDDNTTLFEMTFTMPDGKTTKMLEITYTRM